MLLVFDIPPSLYVQPLPRSLTHTFCTISFFPSSLNLHLLLILNFQIGGTVRGNALHHKQRVHTCKAQGIFHMTG